MQVTCPHCAAQYEFDASAIPAEGYDAQCTSCANVFFVAPAAEAVDAAGPIRLSIACPTCQAVYQFAASEIPPEGYDAQCTQCAAVFFVGRTGEVSASPPAVPVPAAAQEPVLLDTPKQPRVEGPAIATTGPAVVPLAAAERSRAGAATWGAETPESEPASMFPSVSAAVEPEGPEPIDDADIASLDEAEAEPIGAAPAEPQSAEVGANEPALASTELAGIERAGPDSIGVDPNASHQDLAELDYALGEPAASGSSIEDDIAFINRGKLRMKIGAAVVALSVVAATAATYRFMPGVFDATVGKALAVKGYVDPQAIEHFQKASRLLLPDTDEAREQALEELDAALAIDPLYPEALALAGIGHALRGDDTKARGRAMLEQGTKALAELKALDELPAHRRPKDAGERIEELRAAVDELNASSSKQLEAGAGSMARGIELLRRGLAAFANEPRLNEALGVYYSLDPDNVGKAQAALRRAMQLTGMKDESAALEAPLTPWTPYLYGRIYEARGELEHAQRGFEVALAKEGSLQRARFELARLQQRLGKPALARQALEKLLEGTPQHARARALLEAMREHDEAVAAVAPAPAPVPAPQAAPPAGKSKKAKHKGKKRR